MGFQCLHGLATLDNGPSSGIHALCSSNGARMWVVFAVPGRSEFWRSRQVVSIPISLGHYNKFQYSHTGILAPSNQDSSFSHFKHLISSVPFLSPHENIPRPPMIHHLTLPYQLISPNIRQGLCPNQPIHHSSKQNTDSNNAVQVVRQVFVHISSCRRRARPRDRCWINERIQQLEEWS